jgi:hypothetical protein
MEMMSIEIDTAVALRGIDDLRRLVSAVVHASDHDETDWIEWKSTLDLAGKEGCFQVARAILGLANRLPDRALLTCGGLGYVVVGAEPGNLLGIASVDPATLDEIIQPYLGGAGGPVWAPNYVPVEGKMVLVVVVESPRLGDLIFTLRKEFDKYLSGTVFVRKHGRTLPADANDLDALQARLKGSPVAGSDLEVCLVGDVPLSWLDEVAAVQAIAEGVAVQRDRLVAEARAEDQRLHPAASDTEKLPGFPVTPLMAQEFRRIAADLASYGDLLGQPDTRTLAEYVAEVDDSAKRLVAAKKNGLMGRYFSAGHGVVAVQVRNLSQRFLPDVELEVLLASDRATCFDEKPEFEYVPEPRKLGERKPAPSLIGTLTPSMLRLANLPQRPRPRISVEAAARIRFRIGDLRPEATETSERVYLFVAECPESGSIPGDWKATVRGVDAVLTGKVEVLATREPVDFRGLLDAGWEVG